MSEGISFQGAGFCFADENPLKMFKGSCLFCKNLELHSVIIIEVASTSRRSRRSPSPLVTMNRRPEAEPGDRRSRSRTRNGSGKKALSTSPSRSRSSSVSAVDLRFD